MTWSVSISGHSDSEEEEATNLEETRKLVSALTGVSYASFSGMRTPQVNLLDNPEGGE